MAVNHGNSETLSVVRAVLLSFPQRRSTHMLATIRTSFSRIGTTFHARFSEICNSPTFLFLHSLFDMLPCWLFCIAFTITFASMNILRTPASSARESLLPPVRVCLPRPESKKNPRYCGHAHRAIYL